jgi:IQ calmodulin-binding motif
MSSNDQSKFLENIKSKRSERQKIEEFKEKRENGATVIQKTYRGWVARTKFRRKIL